MQNIKNYLGVVIGNGVGEGVGGNLIGVSLSFVCWSWLVGNWSWSISWSSVDSVGNHWSSVDSMVEGSNNWSSVDSVVDGSNHWGVVGNSVVDGGDRVDGDDGSLADWDNLVGSDGGLDLSQTLGVVSLGHGGVCGSEGLALTQGSHLTVSGGD